MIMYVCLLTVIYVTKIIQKKITLYKYIINYINQRGVYKEQKSRYIYPKKKVVSSVLYFKSKCVFINQTYGVVD